MRNRWRCDWYESSEFDYGKRFLFNRFSLFISRRSERIMTKFADFIELLIMFDSFSNRKSIISRKTRLEVRNNSRCLDNIEMKTNVSNFHLNVEVEKGKKWR